MNSKKLKTGIQLLIIACLIFIAYSCIKSNKEPYFIVEVESISLPNTAYAEDTVSIWIEGYLGPTSCYVLYCDPSLYNQNDTTFVIEAWGIQDNSQSFCNEVESRFNHEIKIPFDEPGEYTFLTMQSDKLVELGKIMIEIKSDDDPVIIEEPFTAKIDGIFAQATAFALDTVPVIIFGQLGTTSCYIFDYAEFSLQSDNNVLLEAFGIKQSGDIVCKNATPVFNHKFTVVFDEPGEYTFVTMQSGKLVEVGKILIEPKPEE